MRKSFAILTIATLCGFGLFNAKSYNVAKAENETSSWQESDIPNSSDEQSVTSYENESSEVETSEEENGVSFFDDISQTAKDTIAVVKSVLAQPVVIGGVTMSLGSLVLYLLGKVIDKLTNKKVGKESIEKMQKLYSVIANQQSTIEEQKDAYKQLYSVVELLANNVKNANVKENLLKLLDECKPVVEENTKELVEKVSEETKQAVLETANEVLDILNKD